MMRTLRLYGPMGAQFGRVHRFDLDTGTPAEALRALMSQVRGAREYLRDAAEKGIGFAIYVGKRNLRAEHLRLPANADIRVAPIPAGAKSAGVGNIILGAVVWVVTLALDVMTYGGFSEATGGAGYMIGYGLMIGGVVQLLTPVPHGNSARDKPDNQPSYNFNGAINTQAQGNPVPLAYGRLKVGSAVISAGIDTDDTVYTMVPGGNPRRGFMGGGGPGNIRTDTSFV